MTPQAFSYGTIGKNGMIYIPPYGLHESIDYMIKLNPNTYEVTKIPLTVDTSFEKWQNGTVVGHLIIFLPYNESKVIVLNTDNDSVRYIDYPIVGKGKHICSHVHNGKVFSLPYGEGEYFDYVAIVDPLYGSIIVKKINIDNNDEKKWHTTQYLNGKIYAVPRGERWNENYFQYGVEFDCNSLKCTLLDMSPAWNDYNTQPYTNKKFTTLAQSNGKLYAPPYSENPNFDVMMKFDGTTWSNGRTGLQATSRKYYSHTVAKNGKIYCPPAGHDTDWSEMMIINPANDEWRTIDLNLGKESKKYFTGWENSKGKIYYVPRGGCVCEPVDQWKKQGDFAEILVVDTSNDTYYTVDVSEFYKDSTTIEKYNASVIYNDKIFALPYGQNDDFQCILVFDTITEKVVTEIKLNAV